MRTSFYAPVVVATFCAAAAVTGAPAARAQVKMTQFSEMGTGKVAPAPDTPTVPATAPKNGDIPADPGAPPLAPKVPEGSDLVRQLSAPLNEKGDSVVLTVYKTNGNIFIDAATGKSGQAPIRRNHIPLKGSLPLRPDDMTVVLRPLGSPTTKGMEIVASDVSGSLAIVFPTGFGGSVYQQAFITTTAAGVHRSYDFAQNDSRGVAMVKGTVEGAGAVQPKAHVAFWVWNGKAYIPRRAN